MKFIVAFAGMGALALVSACSSTAPTMNVKSTWGGEMRQYGFTPIYPPRENVYVGDIYLLVENPCQNGGDTSVFQTVLLDTLPASDIQSLETSFDGTRPELPATPQPKSATGSDTPSAANQALNDAVQKDLAAVVAAQAQFVAAATTLAKTNNAANQTAVVNAAAKVKSANDTLTTDQAKLAAATPKGAPASGAPAPAPAADQTLSDAVQKDQTAFAAAQTQFVAAATALAKSGNSANQAAVTKAAAAVKSAQTTLTADQARLAAATPKGTTPTANAQASGPKTALTVGDTTITISSSAPASSGANSSNPSDSQTKAPAAPPANAMTPQPVATSDDPIFPAADKPRAFTRLRLAAFPEMKLGSVTNVELAGSGPFAGIANLGGGAGRNAQTQIDVSVSGVEEDVVPMGAFYNKAVAYIQSQNNSSTSIFQPSLIGRLRNQLEGAMESANPKCGKIQRYDPLIIFVPRVFYARTFDFGFSDSSEIAAFLKASISTPAGTAAGGAAQPAGANSSGAAPASADTLMSNLTALAGNGSPGVGMSASFGTSGAITLKQTFERPLAFGFDESVAFGYFSELPQIMDPPPPSTPPPAPKANNANLEIKPNWPSAQLWLAADTLGGGIAPSVKNQGDNGNSPTDPCTRDPNSTACQIQKAHNGEGKCPSCPHELDVINTEDTSSQPKPAR